MLSYVIVPELRLRRTLSARRRSSSSPMVPMGSYGFPWVPMGHGCQVTSRGGWVVWRQTERQTERQTDRQRDRDRERYRQKEGQKDRQTARAEVFFQKALYTRDSARSVSGRWARPAAPPQAFASDCSHRGLADGQALGRGDSAGGGSAPPFISVPRRSVSAGLRLVGKCQADRFPAGSFAIARALLSSRRVAWWTVNRKLRSPARGSCVGGMPTRIPFAISMCRSS